MSEEEKKAYPPSELPKAESEFKENEGFVPKVEEGEFENVEGVFKE